MTDFQSAVNVFNTVGIFGELAFTGPIRAEAYNLYSAGVPNKMAYAYTKTAGGNPNPSLGSPLAGNAKVGGTGVFAGLLHNPKEYASYGASGVPLGATLALPDYSIGSLLTMGYIYASLPGPASTGDLVTYDPLTGALNSIVPQTQFTGSISTTTLTVSALAAGRLAVGQLISGGTILPGTYITALGSGLGEEGTYTVNISQTVSSAAMTAPNVPAPALSITGSIATSVGVDTLTVASVVSGTIGIGTQLFGVGLDDNTTVVAFGTGAGGTGTYVLNTSGQVITPTQAMTGPNNLFVPNTVVEEFTVNTTGGLAVLKLTN